MVLFFLILPSLIHKQLRDKINRIRLVIYLSQWNKLSLFYDIWIAYMPQGSKVTNDIAWYAVNISLADIMLDYSAFY